MINFTYLFVIIFIIIYLTYLVVINRVKARARVRVRVIFSTRWRWWSFGYAENGTTYVRWISNLFTIGDTESALRVRSSWATRCPLPLPGVPFAEGFPPSPWEREMKVGGSGMGMNGHCYSGESSETHWVLWVTVLDQWPREFGPVS